MTQQVHSPPLRPHWAESTLICDVLFEEGVLSELGKLLAKLVFVLLSFHPFEEIWRDIVVNGVEAIGRVVDLVLFFEIGKAKNRN